jgi:hypothetical protein
MKKLKSIWYNQEYVGVVGEDMTLIYSVRYLPLLPVVVEIHSCPSETLTISGKGIVRTTRFNPTRRYNKALLLTTRVMHVDDKVTSRLQMIGEIERGQVALGLVTMHKYYSEAV